MENVDECTSSAGRPFTHHAFLVMKVVDVCISNIDDLDYTSKLLAEILRIHKANGLSYKLFWKIKQPFLQAVKHTLDERYSDNMETVYITVIDYILLHLSEGISESECLGDDAIKEEIERSGIVSLKEELAKKQPPKSNVGLRYDSSTLTELVSQKTEDEPENDKLQEFGIM
ncbi:uncharacterized protein LOC121371422 isoform X2 [Gigantopelta aegis]|nr:uncharacterized protein LOC121371422 isoform X2 [Gigantopelta aegis]